MGSHSVTCHPAEGHSRPYPSRTLYSIKRPRRDARLSWPSWLVTYRDGIRLKTVTHPGSNRARRALTSFMRRTPLTTTPRRQPSQILFKVLNCPVDIYIALLWHALYSSLLCKMPCVHCTPMLSLPLLYECSVTTILLSGANERRHHQRIGPSLTSSPRTIDELNR